MYRCQKHFGLVALIAVVSTLVAGCGTSQSEPVAENPSVTIYPIMLVDQPNVKVAEVVALLLTEINRQKNR